MKRFIAIFSFFMFLILFAASYSTYNTKSYNRLINSSSAFGFELTIPEDLFDSNPNYLEYLKQSATDNDVNLVRTVSYYDNEKGISYTSDYVYLVTDTMFFKNITIKEGRALSADDMNNPSVFISTEDTGADEQIGVIADFGVGRRYYSIHVLDHILTQYKYSGKYRVECNSYAQFTEFIDDYVSYLKSRIPGIELTRDMYISIDSKRQLRAEKTVDLAAIVVVFFLINFFAFLFYLVSQTKAISVMKLNGFSIGEICRHIFIKFFTKIFLLSSMVILPLMFLIPNNNMEFVIQVFGTNILIFLFMLLLLSFICAVYTRYIKTAYCVKGKKPITAITLFNGIFKMAVSVIIILLAANLAGDMQRISRKQNSLESWAAASDYGVFYPVRTGDDNVDRSDEYPLDIPSYNLYPFLNNEMHAVYINSDLYTSESIEINKNNDYIRKIVVNPNYLREYPVYDENGGPISISEDAPYTIYLVPEQYKGKEKYNYEYFSSNRKRFHKLHTGLYNQEAKPESTEIVFIYTQSGQNIFSFNSNVFQRMII